LEVVVPKLGKLHPVRVRVLAGTRLYSAFSGGPHGRMPVTAELTAWRRKKHGRWCPLWQFTYDGFRYECLRDHVTVLDADWKTAGAPPL
jgi:hypothetical protein